VNFGAGSRQAGRELWSRQWAGWRVNFGAGSGQAGE